MRFVIIIIPWHTVVVSIERFAVCTQCSSKHWSIVLPAVNSLFCIDDLKGSLVSEIEDDSTRVSNIDRFIRSRPLSVSESTDAVTCVFHFEEWKWGAFSIAQAMEVFVLKAVLGATIEFGGLESSPSQGLNQEPLLLYRRTHPRQWKHCIYTLLQFVQHWRWLRLRRLSGVCKLS